MASAACPAATASAGRATLRAKSPKEIETMPCDLIPRREPQRGSTVSVPALPGCITRGKTVEDAQRKAADAIALCTHDMRARGQESPDPGPRALTSIDGALPAA